MLKRATIIMLALVMLGMVFLPVMATTAQGVDEHYSSYSNSGGEDNAENIDDRHEEAIYHEISFNNYDGSLIVREQVPDGEPVPFPLPPTREGYILIGWQGIDGLLEMNAEGGFFLVATSSMTLTAIWQAVPDDDCDNHTEQPQNIECSCFEECECPEDCEDCEKQGEHCECEIASLIARAPECADCYDLLGCVYCCDCIGYICVDCSDPKLCDDCYILFNCADCCACIGHICQDCYDSVFYDPPYSTTFTVVFNLDGGTRIGGGELLQEVRFFNDAVLPAVAREGHTFIGWDASHANIAESMTITALWQITRHTVRFINWDGTEVSAQEVEWGADTELPSAAARTGYNFVRWGSGTEHLNITSDRDIAAVHQVRTFTVTFRSGCALFHDRPGQHSVITVHNVPYGTLLRPQAGVPQLDVVNRSLTVATMASNFCACPARNHRVFSFAQLGQRVTSNMDMTFQMQNTGLTNPNVALLISNFPRQCNVALVQFTTSPTLPRIGEMCNADTFRHTGWTNGGNVPRITREAAQAGGRITVTSADIVNPTSVRDNHTVTFDDNGGERTGGGALSQQVPRRLSATVPAVAREGHTFTGWERTSGTSPMDDIRGNNAFEAQWRVNEHTVRFVDYDNSILSTQALDWGTGAEAPDDPERDGHYFIGWSEEFDEVTRDLMIFAQYEPMRFNVSFVDHNGRLLRSQTVDFGTAATPPPDPARYGYTFTSWDCFHFTVTQAGNRTIIAQYDPLQFYVVFLNYDGSTISRQPVLFDESGSPPDRNPEKYGHTFQGWDREDFTIRSERDLIVRPEFNIIYYAVNFLNYNGRLLSSQEIPHGSGARAPTAPIREGFIFTGWDRDFSYISSNLTVVAQFIQACLYADCVETENLCDECGRCSEHCLCHNNNNNNNEICEDCNMFSERCICCEYPGCGNRRECEHCRMCEEHCDCCAYPGCENKSECEHCNRCAEHCNCVLPLAIGGDDGTRTIATGTMPLGTPPMFSFMGRNIYLFAPLHVASWSIVNLLLTVLGAIFVIVKLLQKKKGDETAEKPEEQGQHKKKWLLPASAFGAIAILLFVLTQDMAALIALLDTWTIAHTAIFIIQIICIKAYNKGPEDEENQQDNEAPEHA